MTANAAASCKQRETRKVAVTSEGVNAVELAGLPHTNTHTDTHTHAHAHAHSLDIKIGNDVADKKNKHVRCLLFSSGTIDTAQTGKLQSENVSQNHC